MVGRTISHYKILDKLGEGGMGVVYKAEDTRLDRLVALKFLSVSERTDEEDKARFAREARAAAALDHPNICTVYEIDEVEGRSFIAMAFLKGRTVQQMVETAPVPIDAALDLAMQAAKGLAAAHQNGIVHRDIKSANLMVTSPTAGSEAQLKIMDFGLAQLTAGASKLTVEGSTLGTAAYMSPEQARGDKVDHRTDLWSLGVVFHELITGQLPFRGEYEQAIIYSILHEPPEPISSLRSGVGLELERIVNKALAKDPDDRYQSAVDLLVDLRTLRKERESIVSRITHPSHVTQAHATQAGTPTASASARMGKPAAPTMGSAGTTTQGAPSAAPHRHPFFHRRWVKFAGLGLALFVVFVAARWVPPMWDRPMGKMDGPLFGWRGRGEPPRIAPITSDAGIESFASFSPDASQIAYTWDGGSGGNSNIYVKLIDGGASLRLTAPPLRQAHRRRGRTQDRRRPDSRRSHVLRQLRHRQQPRLVARRPQHSLPALPARIRGRLPRPAHRRGRTQDRRRPDSAAQSCAPKLGLVTGRQAPGPGRGRRSRGAGWNPAAHDQ